MGADGILGLDSLQDLRVIIDFRDNRLSVVEPARRSDSSEFEIVVRARRRLGQMIITDAVIDRVRIAIVIDTGAQVSMGNAGPAKACEDDPRSGARRASATMSYRKTFWGKRLRVA